MTENDEDGENDHHDKHVLPSVCDTIEMLAKVSDEDYLATFDLFAPLLIKLTDASRSVDDSSMAVGCFAVLMREIGHTAMRHIDKIMPVLQRDCNADEVNRRNACYCISVIVDELSPERLEVLIPQFLEWLLPLLVRKTSGAKSGDMIDGDVDNAIAAVSRIISRCPQHAEVPKLVSMVLASLPLTCDYEESSTVYNMLTMLFTESISAPFVIEQFVDIVKAFIHVLPDDSPYPKDVVQSVMSCLQHLSSLTKKDSLDLQSAMKLLSPSERFSLEKALNHEY